MSFAADAIFPTHNGPGIYAIRCLLDGKVYVGQSVTVRKRLRGHRCLLNGHRHRNRHLQFAWNKHGEQAFEFVLLEECTVGDLRARETHWVKECRAQDDRFGYNFVDPADSVGRQREFIVTDPDGNEQRIWNLNKFCRENGLGASCNMTLVAQGKHMHCKGWLCRYADEPLYDWLEKRDRFSQRSASTKWYGGEYLVTDPKGKEYRVFRLSAFCAEHGLSYDCMMQAVRGVQYQHKGWTCQRFGELGELELERCRSQRMQ